MKRFLKFITKIAVYIIVIVALIFGAYLVWGHQDIKNIRAFCADVNPGTPLDSIPQIANIHGINKMWFNNKGILDEKTGQLVFYVAAASTMGETACAIYHDDKTVISAKMTHH